MRPFVLMFGAPLPGIQKLFLWLQSEDPCADQRAWSNRVPPAARRVWKAVPLEKLYVMAFSTTGTLSVSSECHLFGEVPYVHGLVRDAEHKCLLLPSPGVAVAGNMDIIRDALAAKFVLMFGAPLPGIQKLFLWLQPGRPSQTLTLLADAQIVWATLGHDDELSMVAPEVYRGTSLRATIARQSLLKLDVRDYMSEWFGKMPLGAHLGDFLQLRPAQRPRCANTWMAQSLKLCWRRKARARLPSSAVSYSRTPSPMCFTSPAQGASVLAHPGRIWSTSWRTCGAANLSLRTSGPNWKPEQ
jgi:hypothetical protein